MRGEGSGEWAIMRHAVCGKGVRGGGHAWGMAVPPRGCDCRWLPVPSRFVRFHLPCGLARLRPALVWVEHARLHGFGSAGRARWRWMVG